MNEDDISQEKIDMLLAKAYDDFYQKNKNKFDALNIPEVIIKQIYCAGAVGASSIFMQDG